MFFKIGVLKSFTNVTGKHLCWSLLLKKLASSRPATLLKKASTKVFSYEVYKSFKSTFFYRIPLVTASAPPVAASVFFYKSN